MQQKSFQFFLPQESGALGNNIEKERQKPRPKLNIYIYIYIYILYSFTEYLLHLQSNASGSCLQKCFNFVEQRLIL